MITILDREYPPLLKEIHDPPAVLFAMGNLSLLQKPALAIVGARDADEYALRALDRILPALINGEIVIISGLAKGTDTMAHSRAIAHGGDTIAVIGGGFFHIYPSENKRLAERIAREHLLLSEYPPVRRPEKWHFPMRNRIISGLSWGTLVVQAKERSGSLITADFALEEGREVFAFPGPVDSVLSEGTNRLIQQGAKLVANSTDIMDEMPVF